MYFILCNDRLVRLLIVTLFIFSARVTMAAPDDSQNPLRLWYRQPAGDNWNLALPIGNGRLGAMIFGNVEKERLQLNDDRLYSGEPGRRDLPLDITKDFSKVLEWVLNGDYNKADEYITKNWLGRAQPCYQPLGDVYLDFKHDGEVSDYIRELDINDAMCRVRYKVNGVNFSREIFSSYPDQVIVASLGADQKNALNLRVRLQSVHPTAETMVKGKNELVMTGQVPALALRRELDWLESKGDQWKYPEVFDESGERRSGAQTVIYGDELDALGTSFEVRLRVLGKGGQIVPEESGIRIEGADEVILIVTSGTSFNGFDKSPSQEGNDPSKEVKSNLAKALKKGFNKIRKAHLEDYQQLFNRVSLEIGEPSDQSALATDERLAKFSSGNDPALAVLFFQYGRYLMISGSRPGTQPLNLQGIWNDQVIPPWAGAYTTNINVEMNYWPAEVTNLPECHEPLLVMIQELAVNGAKVAEEMYGRAGWVAHHNTTIWRGAQPVDNRAQFSFWPMAQGWLCQHLYDHYRFTGDVIYLREVAYPVMRRAAEFMIEWLVQSRDGYFLTPIGVSPENVFTYIDETGEKQEGWVSMGPTMDMAIVRELFSNCFRAAQILETDIAMRLLIQERMDRLWPYQIGAKGHLQEWRDDFEEPDPRHRHLSHLYGLHPGSQITKDAVPGFFEAARKSLEIRGDEGTGWSMAWKINMWARLKEGERAWALLRNLMHPADMTDGQPRTGGLLPNLLASCPPFQIDANFGGCAGIAEMLIQSHAGEVELLPALPSAWSKGHVKGLCARDGFEVEMNWDEGRLIDVEVRSLLGNPLKLRHQEKSITIDTKKKKRYRFNGDLQKL